MEYIGDGRLGPETPYSLLLGLFISSRKAVGILCSWILFIIHNAWSDACELAVEVKNRFGKGHDCDFFCRVRYSTLFYMVQLLRRFHNDHLNIRPQKKPMAYRVEENQTTRPVSQSASLNSQIEWFYLNRRCLQ